MMEVTWVLIATIALIAIVTYHLRRLKLYRAASQFSGPMALPIIGNANLYLGKSNEKQFETMTNTSRKYPSPMRLWIGHEFYITIYSPECVKIVLNSRKTCEKDWVYSLLKPTLGDGLLIAPASRCRWIRRMIEPTLKRSILETFIPAIDKQSKIFVKQIGSHVGTGEFEVSHYISLCTLDMICETLLGTSINAQGSDQYSPIIHDTNKLFEVIFGRSYKPWLQPDFIFKRTEHGKFHERAVKNFRNFFDEIIEKRKLKIKELSTSKETAGDEEMTGKIFLDYLIELEDKHVLSYEELRSEVANLTVAGYHVEGLSNLFILLMLATYPELQEKAYEEVRDVFAQKSSKNDPLTSEDLSKLEYVERFIKETLRIFPPGAVVGRRATEDLELDKGEIVPKGCRIAISIFDLHRDEKLWPDPLKFDPDRFLPEEVAKRHPYAYLPFSGGPRNCIGARLGMIEMKIFLARVLKAYVIKKDKLASKISDIRLNFYVFLGTAEPLKIKIEKRSQQ